MEVKWVKNSIFRDPFFLNFLFFQSTIELKIWLCYETSLQNLTLKFCYKSEKKENFVKKIWHVVIFLFQKLTRWKNFKTKSVMLWFFEPKFDFILFFRFQHNIGHYKRRMWEVSNLCLPDSRRSPSNCCFFTVLGLKINVMAISIELPFKIFKSLWNTKNDEGLKIFFPKIQTCYYIYYNYFTNNLQFF